VRKVSLIVLFFISACAATKSFLPSQEALPAMQQKVPDITLEKTTRVTHYIKISAAVVTGFMLLLNIQLANGKRV
jgi:hypothetical protein